MKSAVTKPLLEINSRPVLVYSLTVLSAQRQIKEIILVVNNKNFKKISDLVKKYRIKKIKSIILGGKLRQNSVEKGLKAIDRCTDLVLIHDAVRPFINQRIVSLLISQAQRSGAAILGVPVKATLKKVKSKKEKGKIGFMVEKTLDRDNLWEIQTPQVFKRKLIIEAYRKCANTSVSDDASLVEKLGKQVNILAGTYQNIKITTPEDLILAEAIIKIRNS